EKAPIARIIRHVADGVDMNEESNTGDDEQHDRREWIEQQANRDVEVARAQPGPERDDRDSLLRWNAEHADELPRRQQEGDCHDAAADDRDCHARQIPANEAQREEAGQRRREYPGSQVDHGSSRRLYNQPLSRLNSSTSMLRRVRKIETIIARPTTTSAAATVSTRKTKTQPSTELRKRANAMKLRFTALSINSMDMNITSGLRRTSTPTAPMVKSSALTMR